MKKTPVIDDRHVQDPLDMLTEAEGRLQVVVMLMDKLDDPNVERGGWVRHTIRDVVTAIQADLRASYDHARDERAR